MVIDNSILNDLTAKAQSSSRLRHAYDLRNSTEDLSQRMLNALEPGTELPVHRHLGSNETAICIRGHYEEYFFDDNGVLVDTIDMTPGTVLDVPKGQWHTVKSLESGTIAFEAKDGAYHPLSKDEIMDSFRIQVSCFK